MRDYFNHATGKAIANMSTAEISAELDDVDGIEPASDLTREAIVERLMLELYIRANNLRAGL